MNRWQWSVTYPASLAERCGQAFGILLFGQGLFCTLIDHDLLRWEAREPVGLSLFMASGPVAIALAAAPILRHIRVAFIGPTIVASAALHFLWLSIMLPSLSHPSFQLIVRSAPFVVLAASLLASAGWQLGAVLRRRRPIVDRGFPLTTKGSSESSGTGR